MLESYKMELRRSFTKYMPDQEFNFDRNEVNMAYRGIKVRFILMPQYEEGIRLGLLPGEIWFIHSKVGIEDQFNKTKRGYMRDLQEYMVQSKGKEKGLEFVLVSERVPHTRQVLYLISPKEMYSLIEGVNSPSEYISWEAIGENSAQIYLKEKKTKEQPQPIWDISPMPRFLDILREGYIKDLMALESGHKKEILL